MGGQKGQRKRGKVAGSESDSALISASAPLLRPLRLHRFGPLRFGPAGQRPRCFGPAGPAAAESPFDAVPFLSPFCPPASPAPPP